MNLSVGSFYGKSHIGNHRRENQDRILTRKIDKHKFILAVADGMGGEAGGGLAAATAIKLLDNVQNCHYSRPEDLGAFFIRAGEKIISISRENEELAGMGTTLTAVLVSNNQAVWAHVGDTRLYHLENGCLHQITRDHSFIWELLESGEISQAEALTHPLRNMLDQSLGTPDLKPDCGFLNLQKEDLLVLTSDGLHASLNLEQMERVLMSAIKLPDMADTLIKMAMDFGSRDNLSIVLARIE